MRKIIYAMMLSLGGPTLASTFHRPGLIDEYWLYVNPVVVGRGKPMFLDVEDVNYMYAS
jgi:riboflavin biosynthesis pyrimidine reductase